MNNNGNWTFSNNREIFNTCEYFYTREAAVTAGLEHFEGDNFYVGQIREVDLGVIVDVSAILEFINDNMCDEVGFEVAEDYLMKTKKEHDNELEAELCEVITKWIKKHGYEPTFYKVVNIEKIEVNKRN